MSRTIATTSRTKRSHSRATTFLLTMSYNFLADFSKVGYYLKLSNLHLIIIVHANKGWKKEIFVHPIAVGRVERWIFKMVILFKDATKI